MPNPHAAVCARECAAVCTVLIDRKDPKPDRIFDYEHSLHLREVRLYNRAGAQLLPDKLGAQLSSTHPHFPASMCIDGKAPTPDELGYVDGARNFPWNMCHSADGDPIQDLSPWLRITYPCAEGLSKVEVFNRKDCCSTQCKCPKRITAYKLRFLDATNSTAGVPYEFDTVQDMYTVEAGDA